MEPSNDSDSPVRLTKGDTTRLAIKAAARNMIALDGFAHIKIATIMAATGRTPGAFYKHFGSKEALLHELLNDFKAQLLLEVNREPENRQNVLDTLVGRTGAFWKVYRENWAIATAAFQMSMIDDDFAKAWRSVRQQGIKGLSVAIHEAQKQGYCPDVDVELLASALCSLLEYTCYNWTSKRGDFPSRKIKDADAGAVLMQVIGHAVLWKTSPVGEPDLIANYVRELT